MTGSRILAVFAHAQQIIGYKYMKSWSNFQNFLPHRKSGMEKSNLRSKFTPEVVVWPFLRMRTKSGQVALNPAKTQDMYEPERGELNFVQY